MKLLAAPASGRRRQALAVLAIVAAGLAYFAPDEQPDGTSAAVVPARSTAVDRSPGAVPEHLLELPGRLALQRPVTDLFAGHSWYVPPPPRPVVRSEPTRPVAPPLPFDYMGRFVEAGGSPVYYLVRGDRVFDVHVGDTIDGTYVLEDADDRRLTFNFLPLGERQALNVGR